MKRILYILLLVFFFACTNKGKETIDSNTDTTTKLILTGDSGFITKDIGLEFLLSNSLTDTIPNSSAWYLFKQNDTIGKYYRMENNNYIMCLIDYGSQKEYWFETHIVMEIGAKGELVKSERFFHGNYPCCWNNAYEGFSKYGNFFGIQICGTGSGFCSSDLYLFKEITPQDSISSIPFSCYVMIDDVIATFHTFYTLSVELKKDVLIINYILKEGTEQSNKKKGNNTYKVQIIDEFEIRYFYENEQWHTKENDKLEKLNSFCN